MQSDFVIGLENVATDFVIGLGNVATGLFILLWWKKNIYARYMRMRQIDSIMFRHASTLIKRWMR